jgi:hypothetical protein
VILSVRVGRDEFVLAVRPEADGQNARSAARRYELATHFVQNWSILMLSLVVYFAASHDPPRLGLGAALVAIQVASILHWSDYQHGTLRQKLDIFVAVSTTSWHLWALHQDPAATSVHKYVAWTVIALASMSFLLGCQRHVKGYTGQGMCCHLAFRVFVYFMFMIVHAHEYFSAHDWVLFTVFTVLEYTSVCFALWRCARCIYSV